MDVAVGTGVFVPVAVGMDVAVEVPVAVGVADGTGVSVVVGVAVTVGTGAKATPRNAVLIDAVANNVGVPVKTPL